VDEWLRTDMTLVDILDDDKDDDGVEALSITSRAMPSPARPVIVKCKKCKRRAGKMTYGLSMRMHQLHCALALSRRVLLKERNRSAALKERCTWNSPSCLFPLALTPSGRHISNRLRIQSLLAHRSVFAYVRGRSLRTGPGAATGPRRRPY